MDAAAAELTGALFVQDDALRYLWVLPGASSVAGLAAGRTDEELWPPEVAARLVEAKRRVLHSGVPVTIEIPGGNESGPRLTLDLQPWRDPRGTVRGVAGFRHDAQWKSRLETALRTQFSMLSTIFDALNVVVYVADFESYELLFVNDYTERVFGERWRGRQCFEYLQAGQRVACDFCTNGRLVKDGAPQPTWVWEFQNTRNGRWYLCLDRAIPWVDGRLVRLEVAVDITDRKEAERFREQYVGLVSHDLRNPLSAISMAARVLERKLGERGLTDEAQVAGLLLRNARRMNTMIEDLLESIRLEAGPALNRTRVDLAAMAQELVANLAPGDRQRVEVRTPGPEPCVDGDAARLERVVENLVANALKYSPESARVELVVLRENSHVVVSVVDRGRGIAAEHLPKLFERFYRPPGSTPGGLGLGLYIARLIVEAHAGRIEVRSEPGHGSCFRVLLPALEPEGGGA